MTDVATHWMRCPTPHPGVKNMNDQVLRSDWELAHSLLDKAGVLTVPEGQTNARLVERIEALLQVWEPIGRLSAVSCYDLRFLCNTPEEAIEAIKAHRAVYRLASRHRILGGDKEVEEDESQEGGVRVDQPVMHTHLESQESKWKCTKCGRVGTVGRCCGLETRIPINEAALAEWRSAQR